MTTSETIQTVIFTLNAGIMALLLSEWLKLPGIVIYLVFGILMGPYFLGWVQPDSLGGLLPVIIELGVALIMFEGAIHLNLSQYRSASRAILNLVTVGFLISVLGITLLTQWLFTWGWGVSLLFAVLMSVTGPTVIAPILRKVPLKQPIGSILHWESILLEPIVVVGAILIVEYLIQSKITVLDSFSRLGQIILVGIVLGSLAGFLLSIFIKRSPLRLQNFRNLLLISLTLLLFEVSNLITPNSGLVAVVFAGLIIGNTSSPVLYEIKQFKEIITRVMISFLFILLAANLDWNLLIQLNPSVIFLLIAIIFIIRPAGVFASLWGSGVSLNGKSFLALMAPRGIVAASLASLLAIVFSQQSQSTDKAIQFEILAYQVIFVTVIIQALWSRPLAWLLKVCEEEKKGYLIVGSHPLSVGIAQWLQKQGVELLLIDRDSYDIYKARRLGLNAQKGDALNEYFIDQLPLGNMGYLLALTSNDEVNTLACQLGKRYFEENKIFQVHQGLEKEDESFLKAAGGQIVFSKLPPISQSLEALARQELCFQEVKGNPQEDFIVLFEKKANGSIRPVTGETSFPEESILLGLEKKQKSTTLDG